MHCVKAAMEITTAHGLPRMVTDKPLHVRLAWLIMFLVMTGLFLKGFYDFVLKLQSNQVTNSLEASSVPFQFPDVYTCFENPISGSYSANIDDKLASDINADLDSASLAIYRQFMSINKTEEEAKQAEKIFSFAYPHSIQYAQLIDALAHRKEQAIISNQVTYNADYGTSTFISLDLESFYHPRYLRCFRLKLSDTFQNRIVRAGTSFGVISKILIDGNYSDIRSSGNGIQRKMFIGDTQLYISDWALSYQNFIALDRSSGVRVFLTPPGEYPSDFVNSFSLGSGKHHTVEIGMTQQVYKEGQFDCGNDPQEVQFVNPYDQTPYNHSYSYSYCYYYEYHKLYQAAMNMSGDVYPLPWPLRGKPYQLNLTGTPNYFSKKTLDAASFASIGRSQQIASDLCEPKKLCTTLDYTVSISSADWPTQTSLAPFVNTSIRQVWNNAKANNLSVPALDFLLTGNASNIASYVRRNLLKVHFKPHRVLCERITFSREYTVMNFISDIGGIMGIYLGMSLLTMCELLELLYDLCGPWFDKKKGRPVSESNLNAPTPEETNAKGKLR